MIKTSKTQKTRSTTNHRSSSHRESYALTSIQNLDNKIMSIEEFLLNFYKILIEYVNSSDDLPKVFNLYVIRTKMVKAEVEIFKKLYNNSLIYYRNENQEVSYLVNSLKHNDRDCIDFFIAGKQVLLRFFNMNHKNLSQSLLKMDIKISEWMRILKGFWFFDNTKQTEKLEEFVKHVLVQNESFTPINGVQFLVAVRNFYINLKSTDRVPEEETRKTFLIQNTKLLPQQLSTSDFQYIVPKFENKNMNIGKTAQRFNKKTEVVLPVKKEREDQC